MAVIADRTLLTSEQTKNACQQSANPPNPSWPGMILGSEGDVKNKLPPAHQTYLEFGTTR